jgi:hypothetical protein
MIPPPVLTDLDGRFVLESERVLTFIPWGGWSSVRLTFEADGYRRFQTNYTRAAVATNAPGGVPRFNAGRIILEKKGR